MCSGERDLCYFRIRNFSFSYRDSNESKLLSRLIPRLPHLESLRWEAKADFPIELLRSLLQHGPNSRFRSCLDIGPLEGNQSFSTYSSLLDQVCHTLLSLRIGILCGFEHPEEPRRVKFKLFSALKGFSNLRSLSIYGEFGYNSANNRPTLVVKPLRNFTPTTGNFSDRW